MALTYVGLGVIVSVATVSTLYTAGADGTIIKGVRASAITTDNDLTLEVQMDGSTIHTLGTVSAVGDGASVELVWRNIHLDNTDVLRVTQSGATTVHYWISYSVAS